MQASSVRAALSRAAGSVVEALESRQMLSVTNANGVVTIEGAAGADEVLLAVQAGNADRYEVTLNGDVTRFRVNQIRKFVIITGTGDDTVTVSNANGDVATRQIINVGEDNDTVTIDGDARVTIRGGTGDDEITVNTPQASVIYGNNGNDTINGSEAGEIIDAGGGHDSVFGNGGHDDIIGGSGNDTIQGGVGSDRINGEEGDDLIRGNDGNDYMVGAAGDDTLLGGSGADIMSGDNEDLLTFQGDNEPDDVEGDDSLNGGSADDILLAHTGNDTLEGGTGGDVFDARDGGDTLVDRGGGETIPVNAIFNDPVVSDDEITLRIILNGDEVQIPDDAGDLPGGTSVAEAQDDDGTILFRDRIPRTFRLSEFFQAWGITFDARHIGRYFRTGGTALTMTVNGVNNTDLQNYEIQDGDDIIIRLA
jgi:Ca2+-binding RTX toxin-like protein